MIRARVRLDDEVGAHASYLEAGSADAPLVGISAVVTNTIASALLRSNDHPLTSSSVTFVSATVGLGRDSFSRAEAGM